MISMDDIQMGAAAVSQVVNTAKHMRELFSKKPSDTSSEEIRKLLSDLLDQSLNAKQANIALVEKLSALRQELATARDELEQLRRFNLERDKYELKPIAPSSFVYVLKQSDNLELADLRFCPSCFDKGMRSILQLKKRNFGSDAIQCHTCHAELVAKNEVRRPRPSILLKESNW